MSEQELKQAGKSPTERPDLRQDMALEEYFLLYNGAGELELYTEEDDDRGPISTGSVFESVEEAYKWVFPALGSVQARIRY